MGYPTAPLLHQLEHALGSPPPPLFLGVVVVVVFFNVMGVISKQINKLQLVVKEGKGCHQTQLSIVVKHLDFKHWHNPTA